MAEDRYNKDIGEFFRGRGVKVGISLSCEDENSLIDGIQREVATGSQYIEIASLAKQGAGRTFGFSSHLVSEIRRLRKFNSLSFGVHASPLINISGFSNNGFSAELRNQAIQEIKASIDVAYAIGAEILVLHPNSFPRLISDIEPGTFGMEGVIKIYYLVDPKTEAIIAGISERDLVFIPQQAKDKKGDSIWLVDKDKKPILDSITGQPISCLSTDENGKIKGEQMSFAEYIRPMKRNNRLLKDIIKDFFYLQFAGEINTANLRLREVEKTLTEAQSRRDRLQETFDYARDLNQSTIPQERWRFERNIHDRLTSHNIPVPADMKSILSLLEDEIQINQRIIEGSRQTLNVGLTRLTTASEQFREIKLLEEHGAEKLSEAIAVLGQYCISKSNSNHSVCLAIENLPQPEMFGSHPPELLEIINESRDGLSFRLQKNGRGKSSSRELARKFIGATLDIGHLNLFRKYYRGDAFHKWTISKVECLMQNNVIYNLHLSDNRGMDDSHLLIGEGNAPVKEALEVLADADYKGYIVVESGGARDGVKGISHTWDLFGILPRSTHAELIRPFSPRDSFAGLERKKDDPERPFGGWI